MSSLPLIFSAMCVLLTFFFLYHSEVVVGVMVSASLLSISGSWELVSLGFNYDQLSVLMVFLSFLISSTVSMLCTNLHKKMLVVVILLSFVINVFFLTDSLLWFFILFEVSLIPLLLIISVWGKQAERVAAIQYMMLYTVIGSSPLLYCIIGVVKNSGSSLFSITPVVEWCGKSEILFSLMMTAFLVKIPVFFFHSWLPKAHVEAPLEGSMLLAGLMLKLGMYGLIRMTSILELSGGLMNLIFSMSIVGTLLSVVIALSVDDMKMSVAFSSVSHMNLIVSSVMTMKMTGYYSSIIIMFSHGICSPILFFLVTKIYNSSNSRSVLISKGSWSCFPTFSLVSLMTWIINLSTPPFFSFTGEILSLMSILSFFQLLVVWVSIYMSLSSFFCMVNYGIHCHSPNKLHTKSYSLDFLFLLLFSLMVVLLFFLFIFHFV